LFVLDLFDNLIDFNRLKFFSGSGEMIAVPRLIGEVSIRLFVRHGDQQRALDFYENVFGAQVVGRPYLHNGELIAAELRMGASVIMIVGANPKRDADASLGWIAAIAPECLPIRSGISGLSNHGVSTSLHECNRPPIRADCE
jgi:hypothetical protein